MRTTGSTLQLSASDLSHFLGCRHRTGLDLAVAMGQRARASFADPVLQILWERGLEHERGFVQSLRAQGLSTVDLSDYEGAAAVDRSHAALRDGIQVIVQGALGEGRWFGRPDVLRRVDKPSRFGGWSYEVIDTKLALRTRGGTVLQLALYCDLLQHVQTAIPELFHVVTPDTRNPVQSFRTHDFLAYFRLIRRQFEMGVERAPEAILRENYPEPVEHCEVCIWRQGCDQRRRSDDHLSFVAGMTRLQRRELELVHVQTLEQLATTPLPLPFTLRRGAIATYERVREQARVQLAGRAEGRLIYELLPITSDRGLARLPAPSPGDVFFDLEGDSFVADGGREYLFGLVAVGEDLTARSTSLWAWSRAQESAAFEAVVEEIERLWTANPGMHVYHYGTYEPGALKRLMGRYATREESIDRLLRAERFVDLHAIVRDAVRASVESYSIKDLEPFYDFERKVSLAEARAGLRIVERALEFGVPDAATEFDRAQVQGYNLDDCYSALKLRDWLESLRASVVAGGREIPRPELTDGAPSEKLEERTKRVAALVSALTAGLPPDPLAFDAEQRARWLAAQLLDWHRREAKAPWWEFFRLRDLSDDELMGEKAAISGLTFLERTKDGTAKCPIDRYAFPQQETEVRTGFVVYLPGEEKSFGGIERMDRVARIVDVKKAGAHANDHPAALFGLKPIYGTQVLEDALFRIGEDIRSQGVNGGTRYSVARDLLCRRPPRLTGGASFTQLPGETAVDFAVRIAGQLDKTVLPIQGPPGAGKTYTGARMICALLDRGARIGVTAVSHEVIRNLLRMVLEVAGQLGCTVECVRKVGEASEDPGGIRELTDNKDIDRVITAGGRVVVGGTQFLWARKELEDKMEVLFVDEAGQMSLANVLAASQCAKNIVLLGDPQQLEQPQHGSHPEGAGVSALEHLLEGRETIAADRGIFLPETWRLPVSVCAFTSEVFYENRLKPHPDNLRQRLSGTAPVAGEGLWVLPVAHDGNQNSSTEEVAAVDDVVQKLLASGGTWTDRDGDVAPLAPEDILVVAPYNAQVALLSERLAPQGVRAGTVDKFQGQEAPVVIYSMTASTPEDAPKGMEFLYSLNRLNVATSRAQCACILVANPRLFEPECKTPRQMQLANALCRYLEMATEIDSGGAEPITHRRRRSSSSR